MMKDAQAMVYKDTITPLNEAYWELIGYYSLGDTRVSYLKTFELTLSLNCPNKMLWNFDQYIVQAKLAPLPKDQRQRVDPETFLNYLMVYEQIMREVGLIDKDPMELQPAAEAEMIDMGDE